METQVKENTKRIEFEAKKDALILKSPMFATLDIKNIEDNKYFLEIEASYVDIIKEKIERNGGKILW